MTIKAACLQVQTYMRSLSGIRTAPAYPPDSASAFPFCVTFPETGIIEIGPPEVLTALHNITIEIHVGRKDLPKDIEAVIGFAETIPNLLVKKLKDDSYWNNTITTFTNITYTFGPLEWGGIGTIGFRFSVNGVKIKTTIT